ncbi:hypothetical protein HWI79_1957 [Cryptosporidium felis]|nr:hypothetical protein HWI79_1957 [Cryptosporidium felis]
MENVINSGEELKEMVFNAKDTDEGTNLEKDTLRETLEEGENFYPLLESSLEDEMANGKVPLSSFMDKFKQLHESKVRSMNLEQIDSYCKELLDSLKK